MDNSDDSVEDDLSPFQEGLFDLLGVLCVEWGFCINFDDSERIIHTPDLTARDFAEAVVKANGAPSEEWTVKIAARFTDHFSANL